MPTLSPYRTALAGPQPAAPSLASSMLDSVLGLMMDAQASLDWDRASAHLALSRAIKLLSPGAAVLPIEGTFRGGLAPWQMKRLTAHIDSRLDSRIQTSELAALLGLSVSHFSRAFKLTLGITALAYLARRRIEAAGVMMLETDEPLTRIAHLHGFCDQSHFTRTFRRETGMAPQVWRRIQKG